MIWVRLCHGAADKGREALSGGGGGVRPNEDGHVGHRHVGRHIAAAHALYFEYPVYARGRGSNLADALLIRSVTQLGNGSIMICSPIQPTSAATLSPQSGSSTRHPRIAPPTPKIATTDESASDRWCHAFAISTFELRRLVDPAGGSEENLPTRRRRPRQPEQSCGGR